MVDINIQIQIAVENGNLPIQRRSKKLWLRKTEVATDCFMILVDIFDIFEIIIFRVIICQVL